MSSLLLILWLTWKKPTPTELKFYQKDGNIGQKLSLGRSKTRGSLYIKHVWTIFPYDQAKQSAFKKDKSDQQHSKWPATLALVSNLNDPCWTHKACLRTPRCPSMKPFAVGDGCVKKMSREPREKKKPYYLPLYWLVNIWILIIIPYIYCNLNNQGPFCHCSCEVEWVSEAFFLSVFQSRKTSRKWRLTFGGHLKKRWKD